MPNSHVHSSHPMWQIPTAGGTAAIGNSSLQSSGTAIALSTGIVVAVFAPWLAHLLPVQGAPLGPVWLPMFYAPLLAALLLRLPLAVAVSVATPVVSRLLTGMPGDPVLPGMVLQIALFVVAIRLLRRYHWLVVVPVAYLASLLIAQLITAMMPDVVTVSFAATIQTSLPGVAVLAGLGFLAHKTLR